MKARSPTKLSRAQTKTSDSSESPTRTYQDLVFVKALSKVSAPVHLVYSNSDKTYYAMKVFPYKNDQPTNLFFTEVQLMNLRHPNIISILDYKEKQESIKDGKSTFYSYILMELAPYGDFCDLVLNQKLPRDDVLIRTYFHQLIEGLEYMHSQGVAHLDLKLENLLLGEGYLLKIADFDACQFINKGGSSPRKGTMNFRAPEVKSGRVLYPTSADVYSAGVILFALKSGMLPYREDKTINNYDMYKLLQSDVNAFWDAHNDSQDSLIHCDEDFQNLFVSMVNEDPLKRATIGQIKKSKWYAGPTYSKKELRAIMKSKAKVTSILKKNFY